VIKARADALESDMRKWASYLILLGLFCFRVAIVAGQTVAKAGDVRARVCAPCIRAHMEFLASDALAGRGSGTHDELVAATYVASELRAYGAQPAGDDGGYLQRAALIVRKLKSAPELDYVTPAARKSWCFGKDFLVIQLAEAKFSGPLQKVDVSAAKVQINKGAMVLVTGQDKQDKSEMRRKAFSAIEEGASGAMVAFADEPDQFDSARQALPSLPPELESHGATEMGSEANVLELSAVLGKSIEKLPEGTILSFEAPSTSERGSTWNVIAELHGQDPGLRNSSIVLSAHLDHLGIGPAVDGDDIYNGADDDASGVAAVLELARVMATAPRRRTVIFALFGSEETGGLGSSYFRDHPPLPLKKIAADLEFEMIGRRDSAVSNHDVWLTGWERSNLGPMLAAQGAKLVADPHPEQHFFSRSDNYVLAKRGVVAQTISSYGLHADYHQPSDDLAHIDFRHLDAVIGSLLQPIRWLANSDFTPRWNQGGKP
jgi:aminopeptidase YwaD